MAWQGNFALVVPEGDRSCDIATNWHSVDPPVKQVIRRISSTFWFIREMLPYGKDCEVISPQPVREVFIDEHRTALENYSESSRKLD